MRTTVDIEADLLAQLRRIADDEGVPFRHVLARIIRRGLAVREPVTAPERRTWPTYDLGAPVAADAADLKQRLASLDDEEWAARRRRETR